MQLPRGGEVVPNIEFSELAVEHAAMGAGSFKSVFRARWAKKNRDVAVLVLRNSDSASLSDFENEIRTFSAVGKHRCLAELLATCTQIDTGNKRMVMEFAPLGSLDHVLNKAVEDDTDVSDLVLMQICMQVAEGMVHLHLYDIIHRDLALRNILVFLFDPHNWKRIRVKVTDYGLALLILKGYTKGSSSVVEVNTEGTSAANPVRWMAVESLQRRQYSKKSDVWSYGVLKYEIWSLGFMPYHNIYDDSEVSRAVIGGERLPRPAKCPEQMYAIMQSCWRSAPKDRPSMSDVQTRLQESFAEAMLEASKTECVICLDAGQ
jgi:serine/threonine protein kinase